MQVYLLKECLKYGDKKDKEKVNYFDFKNLWEWPLTIDYVYFIVCLVILLCLISNLQWLELYYVEFSLPEEVKLMLPVLKPFQVKLYI